MNAPRKIGPTEPLKFLVCDCCLVQRPSLWLFPHGAFKNVLYINGAIKELFTYDAGDWAACDRCAAAIVRHDPDALVAIWKEEMDINPAHKAKIALIMHGLFTQLLEEITGEPQHATLKQLNAKWWPEKEAR